MGNYDEPGVPGKPTTGRGNLHEPGIPRKTTTAPESRGNYEFRGEGWAGRYDREFGPV